MVRARQVALNLTFVVAAGWIVCFWPARALRGDQGVLWMTLAAFSCLVPGWIVAFVSGLTVLPNELAAMLVQTAVRLGSVAGVALAVKAWQPQLGVIDFYGWLIGFYLLTLLVEVLLLNSPGSKSVKRGVESGSEG